MQIVKRKQRAFKVAGLTWLVEQTFAWLRFNGRLWKKSDKCDKSAMLFLDLSQALGLGAVQPALAGGSDFAFGGAVTGPAVPGATTTVPNVVQQIGLFSVATGGHAPSTGLYAVWIGANDIFTALDGLLANTLTAVQAKEVGRNNRIG